MVLVSFSGERKVCERILLNISLIRSVSFVIILPKFVLLVCFGF